MSDVKRLLDEATPLPWILPNPPDGVAEGMIYGSDGWAVVDGMLFEGDRAERTKDWRQPFTRPDGQHLANAALIVYAVNALPDYEAAVDALERLIVQHETQADLIHGARERGFHDSDGWQDCVSLMCTNARADITPARAALRRLRGKPDA